MKEAGAHICQAKVNLGLVELAFAMLSYHLKKQILVEYAFLCLPAGTALDNDFKYLSKLRFIIVSRFGYSYKL